MNRGFTFPVHEFFRGLMYVYGVQLNDFTPNAILHVSCFIIVCECFLGVHPHWGLWQRIFNVKRNACSRDVYPVGGFRIQTRGDIEYFDLKLLKHRLSFDMYGAI